MSVNQSSKKIVLASGILLTLGCQELTAQMYPLTLKGKASGETLILGTLRGYGCKFVSIQTSAGESAESVARRLADQITINHANPDCPDTHRLWWGYGSKASGPTLKLGSTLNEYYIAGTETGLGIPEPPVFLTVVHDAKADTLRLAWENPPAEYDKIFVTLEWRERDSSRVVRRSIPGNATSFVASRKDIERVSLVDVKDLFVAVVGFRDGIMSAPGAMHMSGDYQDEAFAIPFAQGIMPNWSVWRASRTGQGGRLGRRAAMGSGGKRLLRSDKEFADVSYYTPDMGMDERPFYQVIEASPSDQLGVYRKFLGLTPGHTYRITAALSTLQMDTIKGDWSLSVCAAHNEPEGTDLTVEQLAGESRLPNGKRGSRAGLIMSSRRGKNMTGRGFRTIRSKSPSRGGQEGVDVTLPPDVDTLTVWVRFNCSDPAGRVGFKGAGIEDITASGKAGPAEPPD